MVLNLTLPGPPRTKKTHNRIVGVGKPCRACGKREFQKVLPSEQYEEWFKAVLEDGPVIRGGLARVGFRLPIADPLEARALVYRDRDQGDLGGFLAGIADAIQEQLYGCQAHNTRSSQPCCLKAKVKRDGLGIIKDDRQIVSWDGSRLLIDKQRPRVELQITVIAEPQASLFEEREVLTA